MSNESYPYLYLTMNCEMIYIIEQRLTAQGIFRVKAQKVLNDILLTVFNTSSIDKIFERKYLLTLDALKKIIMEIAHSSIMKLNDQSMNKLFDLMVMVTKYQLVLCQNSLQLFDIVNNHLDSVSLLTENELIRSLIEVSKKRFIEFFKDRHIYRLQMVKTTLLAYFIGVRTRVSALIRSQAQDSEGNFIFDEENIVNCYCQIPGTINHFDENGCIICVTSFSPGGMYREATSKTTLGLNIYGKEGRDDKPPEETKSTTETQSDSAENQSEPNDPMIDHRTSEVAKREVNLLANLIGKSKTGDEVNHVNIWMDLDENGDSTSDTEQSEGQSKQVELTSSNEATNYSQLLKIRDEMNDDPSKSDETEDDLLALVDS